MGRSREMTDNEQLPKFRKSKLITGVESSTAYVVWVCLHISQAIYHHYLFHNLTAQHKTLKKTCKPPSPKKLDIILADNTNRSTLLISRHTVHFSMELTTSIPQLIDSIPRLVSSKPLIFLLVQPRRFERSSSPATRVDFDCSCDLCTR